MASIKILDGGSLKSQGATLGKSDGDSTTVLIDGVGSRWTTTQAFTLNDNASIQLHNGGTLDLGDHVLTLSGNKYTEVSIGSLSAEAAVAPGILKTPEVAFAANNSDDTLQVLAFKHTANGLDFSPKITGKGSIVVEQGLTRLTADSSTFSGETVITGGSLEVAGKLGGTLIIENGQLKVSGTIDSQSAVELQSTRNSSLLVEGENASLTTASTVNAQATEGKVDIKILDGGSLKSQGATLGKPGDGESTTVLIDGAGSHWAATQAFTLNDNASVQLRNGGTLDTGNKALSLQGKHSRLILGGEDAAAAAGTLSTQGLEFSSLDDSAATQQLVFNHNSDNYKFGAPITGRGHITQQHGVTLLTGDSASFAGQTDVQGGTLRVDGKLGGTLAVHSGAFLSGTGQIGSTVINEGGTLSAGGAQPVTVMGDLEIKNGGALSVALASDTVPTQALLNVSGKTKLEETSKLDVEARDAQLDAPYLLLKATGGVEGKFGAVSQKVDNNLAFIDTTLDYNTPGQISLTLTRRANDTFASQAVSSNERAVANALDHMPEGGELSQFVQRLPKGAPAAVFDALAGDAHTSVSNALQQSAVAPVIQVPMAHLRSNLQASLLPGAPLAQSGGSYPASALPSSAAQPLWVQTFGSWQHDKGDSNAPGGRAFTGGLFIGLDQALGKNKDIRLGAALGYSQTQVSIRTRSAKATIDNFSLTAYGGKQWETGLGQLNLLVGGAYTSHHIRSKRDLSQVGLADTLRAGYQGNTVQLFTELGHAFPWRHGYVEPYAGISLNRLHTDSYSENGGSPPCMARRKTAATS